ncbi:hypothetical protein MBLNU459_g6775t1 [Dothideomycetes sp. NU459]
MSLSIANEFGIATVSLGGPKQHSLESRLAAASAAGFKQIDLFDDCWGEYLRAHGQDPANMWDATDPKNLALARQLGAQVRSHGMRIWCTQPLRAIEGRRDPRARAQALRRAAQRFPFMRAFDTTLVFVCSGIECEPVATADLKTVAADVRELGVLAERFARADGGPMLRVGYEGLSWGRRNTWAASWEVVRAANRHNVGLVVDSFNLLGAEWADPYNPAGHGRVYASERESADVLRVSLAGLVATVPGDRIFMYQVADAERMDPKTFLPPPSSTDSERSDPRSTSSPPSSSSADAGTPALMPWSRKHRLYPLEKERGAYLPVDLVTAAVLATGYTGPLSLEVFNATMYEDDPEVPTQHAKRGSEGLDRLVDATKKVPKFWGEPAQSTEAHRLWKEGQTAYSEESISVHS